MRPWHWLLGIVVVLGVGAAAAWEYFETGSGPADKGERPIAGPQRVSNVDGEPMVTLSAEAQRASGVQTTTLRMAHYRLQVRAYGTVLDLEPLTNLSNSYVSALSARQTAQARLEASKPAYERAKALYKIQGASRRHSPTDRFSRTLAIATPTRPQPRARRWDRPSDSISWRQ